MIDEATGNHPQQGLSTLKLVQYDGRNDDGSLTLGMELTAQGKTSLVQRHETVAREFMAKFRTMCGC